MGHTKNHILRLLRANSPLKTSFIASSLKLTRQTIAHHLKSLVESGQISKTGSTKAALYSLNNKATPLEPIKQVQLLKTISGLEEHLVYKELELKLSLNKHLNKNARSIGFYAFGELLNNAVEHSEAKKVSIQAQVYKSSFQFTIKDSGVGVFCKIKKYFKLSNEFDAVNWLLSGKKTTMPSRHSGEGLFFTSKISDVFSLKSHKSLLKFDNDKKDTGLAEVTNLKGTEAFFSIRCQTKKKLVNVFKEYTDEDFNFNKSRSTVKISSGQSAVSRSQARKLLASFDDFDQIIIDLSGVKEIGQAFCDEIFRVYKSRHPEKIISWVNATSAVEFMIQRSFKV